MYDLINYINNFIETSKFWLPLILSIISAFIFWIVFSYYPVKKRAKQLRPIIELDIYSINLELMFFFDLLFSVKHNFPSLFREEIIKGKLTKEDFQIALQNKCLNDLYKYPDEIAKGYVNIGEDILLRFTNIERLIDKITALNQYVSSEELLLLEKIRTNIKIYGFDEKSINKSPILIINNSQCKEQVSNLEYMHNDVFKLYRLYNSLQKIIFLKYKYNDKDIFTQKVKYLFYQEQFKMCKKAIKKEKKKYQSVILEYYYLLCEYKLNKLDYKKIEIILNKEPLANSNHCKQLISSHSNF